METTTIEKLTLESLKESFKDNRKKHGELARKKAKIEEEMQILDQQITRQEKEIQTSFKEVDGVIFEVLRMSDFHTNFLTLDGKEDSKDYFYSKDDKKVHRVHGWHSGYYYDEQKEGHINQNVYRVISTDNPEKYPDLPVLSTKDLVRLE